MSQTLRLGPFRGLLAAAGGDAPPGFAGSLLNVRLGDGAVRPRYGYRNLAAMPAGLTSVHGLARLSGYGANYAHKEEWVSLEDRGAGVRPYSIDPATFARTEITSGGAHLDLNAGDWLGFAYNGSSYFVNPGGSPSVYRHDVGDAQSWTSLQDTEYVDTGPDPTFGGRTLDFSERPWQASDARAIGGNMLTVESSNVVDGRLEVHGYGNPGEVRTSIVTVTPTAPLDLSYADYLALRVAGAEVVPSFNFGLRVELKISGAWVALDQRDFKSDADTDITTVARLRGVVGTASVEAVRITVKARPNRESAGTAYVIYPLSLGGTYIGSQSAAGRPWDSQYHADDVTYGVRFKTTGGTPQFTGIKSLTLAASRFEGLTLAGSCPAGSRVEVEATSLNVAPWVRDEAGTAVRIEYLRKDAEGKWRVLGDVPNGDGNSWIDRRELWELPALPLALDEDYTDPTPPPVFSSVGFVAGVPYKGWVVWFRAGGKGNVQHSRVGNAESLYSPGDDAGDGSEGSGDQARGQDFTLADDFADEPLGGVQAGDALLIAGREGVYGQAGNSPSTMTPTRKLPGSMGCAGRFAFARYRDEAGNYGMAWLDVPGEAVWFAAASLSYSSDTQARPVELSLSIRGTIRSFLYEEQRETFPGLSLAAARMDVDEATGSLWLVLGARALVLRPPSPIDGQRQWERCAYALGSGTGDVSVCAGPFGPISGASEARGVQTLADWDAPGAVIEGPDFASAGPFLPGARSRWLRASSFAPPTGIPAEGTLSSVKVRVRHRATPSEGAPTPIVLSAMEVYRSGALVASLALGFAVPHEWEDLDVPVDFAAAGITADDVNAGRLSARIAYDASPLDPDAFDPANWDVDVVANGPTGAEELNTVSLACAFEAHALWIAGGDPPPYVPLSLYGWASGTTGHDVALGTVVTATVDDGLGPPVTGTAGREGSVTSTHTVKRIVAMVEDEAVGIVSMSGTSSVSKPGYAQVLFALEAAVVDPDPSFVQVQEVGLMACYVVPQAETARTIAYLAFGPDRNLVWLRSSGHLDSVEWCPTCARYVEGANRDGGLVMPEGHWETGRLSGALRRLARAEIEREGYGALALSATTDRAPLGAASTAPQGQRWARWGVALQGRAHRVRIVVDESTVGVRAMDLVFQPVSGPGR